MAAPLTRIGPDGVAHDRCVVELAGRRICGAWAAFLQGSSLSADDCREQLA